MKKIVLFLLLICLCACENSTLENNGKLKELPKPELSEGQRGTLGIDKNINEKNLDEYLNRDDTVYFDMRMLNDPANYQNIGGDSMLSGYVKGFKIIPFPYICTLKDLPEEVGIGYQGKTLWTLDDNGYHENYKESKIIIEQLFPKDKNIFLMCGGGGYAGFMKKLLIEIGYEPDKIYNVGGYWNYKGRNKIEINTDNGIYDYSNIPYYEIDFSKLNLIEEKNNEIKNEFIIEINDKKLKELENSTEEWMLFIYTPGCTSCAKFKNIIDEYFRQNKTTCYMISSENLNKSNSALKEFVEFAPFFIIFDNGEIKDYLDSNSDKNKDCFESIESFTEWMNDNSKKDETSEECSGITCSIKNYRK